MIRMKVMRSCWTTTIQTLKKNTSMAAPILSIDRPIDFKPGATARSVCCTKLMLLRYALVWSSQGTIGFLDDFLIRAGIKFGVGIFLL